MKMKRLLPFLLLFAFCPSIMAGIADDGEISDGEYDYGFIEIEDENLLVTGGGASSIDAYGSSYITILNTSPLSSSGGIEDLNLGHTTHLEMFDGEIGVLDFRGDSTGEISGGSINYIRSFQLSDTIKHITFICDVDSVNLAGNLLTGDWLDEKGNFSITLLDQSPYDSVYSNINFIVPEPATVVLLGLGGFLIRRKK